MLRSSISYANDADPSATIDCLPSFYFARSLSSLASSSTWLMLIGFWSWNTIGPLGSHSMRGKPPSSGSSCGSCLACCLTDCLSEESADCLPGAPFPAADPLPPLDLFLSYVLD